ncbi:hypothetical protein, partial [Hydrogenivirga sp.]
MKRGRKPKGKKPFRMKLLPDTYEKLKTIAQKLDADIDQTLRFMEGLTALALLTLAGVEEEISVLPKKNFSPTEIKNSPTEKEFQSYQNSNFSPTEIPISVLPIIMLYFQEVEKGRVAESLSPYEVEKVLESLMNVLSLYVDAPVHRLIHRLYSTGTGISISSIRIRTGTHTDMEKEKKNNPNDTTTVVSLGTTSPYAGEVVSGDTNQTSQTITLSSEEEEERDSPPKAKEKSPTKKGPIPTVANDLQSQQVQIEGGDSVRDGNTPDRAVGAQGVENTKNAKEGKGLGEFASRCLPRGVERHRKRVKEKVKSVGKRWDIDPLLEVIELWEVMYGEWREEWDEVLIELRSYFSPKRIEKMLSSSTEEKTKGSFLYFASIPLKQIADAIKQGKEEAKTVWGKVKVVRRGAGISQKVSPSRILQMWNEKAQKEKLMLVCDAITPLQREILGKYIAVNDSEEFWKKVIDTVPLAIGKTQRSSEPRSFAWLFRRGRNGLILDWILELASTHAKTGEKRKRIKKFIMRARLEKFLHIVEESGMTRDDFKELLKKRRIRVEKDDMTENALWFS